MSRLPRTWTLCALLLPVVTACAPVDVRDYGECTRNDECVLAFGGCGCPGAGGLVGVRRDRLDSFRRDRCGDDYLSCPATCLCICPSYATHVATCWEGQCGAFPLVDAGFTQCARDEDCAIRGQACCAPSDPPYPICEPVLGTIAISSAHVAEVDALLCDPGSTCRTSAIAGGSCVEGQCRLF